jgi:Chalcone isomerase-like
MLQRRLVLAAAFAAAAPAWAQKPIRVEGYTFPGSIALADAVLQLNGAGYRAVGMLKGYAAGLYLPRRATTTPQVLAQAGPKRLQLRMLHDVDAEEFVKAFHKGVRRNTPPADAAKLADRAARFSTTVRGLVRLAKRDLIDLDFVPGRGLVLARNGQARGEPVAGEDFYAALLRCFIGDHPADAEMKVGLLGGPVG